MLNYSHAYLVGSLVPLPIWFLLFYLRKDLRKEMLIIGTLGGFLAVLFAPAVLQDYWHPIYIFNKFSHSWPLGGLEDFIYTFFTVGIGSVCYEELFGKRFAKRKNRDAKFHRFVLPALALYILSFYIPVWLGATSLYAALISFAVLVAVIVGVRRDLLFDALLSGLILGTFVVIGYVLFLKAYPDLFQKFFYASSRSGIHILGVPVDEILWAFGMGAAAGPVYEFFMGIKFQKK